MTRTEPRVLVVTHGFGKGKFGAGNETRTRDLNLGKVVLYQLSYSRVEGAILQAGRRNRQRPMSHHSWARIAGPAARR